MSYLDWVEYYMDLGFDEDSACREACREMSPETFDAEDWLDTY